MLNPDVDASISFLKQWHPTNPWALVAIPPGGGRIHGSTFSPDTEDGARKWLKEQGAAGLNIYFHVNTTAPHVKGKASRDDITHVTHFHCDIDPRAGEDLQRETVRIKDLIANPPEGTPPPTWVNFSGGGYQIFWELDEPIEIGRDIEKAESAKRYNLQLERLFKADNCHNVDRLMRLPGTLNVPDAKKKAKGRTLQLARVESYDPGHVYPVATFSPAPQVQVDTGFASQVAVQISGNVARAADIDQIRQWAKDQGGHLADNIAVLIVQAEDPDDPDKYDHDRSKALFACVCGLHRANLTPDQMYSIITDPDWKISESVLDKGGSVERYAKRQIERAIEHTKSPELLTLNERHAVISSYGGKCVVVEEVMDDTIKRSKLVKQSFSDFRNRYMNKKVSLGTVNGTERFEELGKWWLQNPDRRQYDYVTFAPAGCKPSAYNLWQGFACEQIPGDCEIYLRHIFEIICSGNQKHYDYLLNWMARTVQHPEVPGEVAVILRGKRGTGKGVFITNFGNLFGRHFLQVSNPDHIVGNFNQHLRDCVVLFGDEAFFAGDKKHESTLKTLITEERSIVEAKGVDAEAAANCVHLMMASNSDWVVPAGVAERRFFVLDVSDERIQDHVYFGKVTKLMKKGGGYEALLHLLMSRDVTDFNHRLVPETDALIEQKEQSMTPLQEWWMQKLMSGELQDGEVSWSGSVSCNGLYQSYQEYARDKGINRRVALNGFSRFLATVVKGGDKSLQYRQRIVTDPDGYDKKVGYWLFPSLEACREFWDVAFFRGKWPNGVIEQHFDGSDAF